MRRYLALFLSLLLSLMGCASGEPAAEETDAIQTAAAEAVPVEAAAMEITEESAPEELDPEVVQSIIESVAEKYGAVGIQVAVVHNGAVSGTYAYGWATIDEDTMTTAHKMRVASISKVVVGIAAMLLQEDGVIDLDQDIGTYWGTTVRNPAYPGVPITIRSLLNHTSSICNYGDGYATDYASVRSRFESGYSTALPGDIHSWEYNNYAFRVLGLTLELAAGQRIDDILQEKLFTAMQIDAAFAPGDLQDTAHLVTLYRADGTLARSVEEQLALHMPEQAGVDGTAFAGAFTASAEDLAKMVALLAADGIYQDMQLMTGESVALMETYIEQPLSDGSCQALPLVYVPQIYDREGIYYHPGCAYGVYNCISYDPLTGDGIVVLTTGAEGTADRYDIYNVCDEINRYLYAMLAEL